VSEIVVAEHWKNAAVSSSVGFSRINASSFGRSSDEIETGLPSTESGFSFFGALLLAIDLGFLVGGCTIFDVSVCGDAGLAAHI